MSERPIAPALAVIGAIVAANVATSALGMVTWLGVAATAGTWLAGLALVARDWLHRRGPDMSAAVAVFMAPSDCGGRGWVA